MNSHGKKMIAPVIIGILLFLYYAGVCIGNRFVAFPISEGNYDIEDNIGMSRTLYYTEVMKADFRIEIF